MLDIAETGTGGRGPWDATRAQADYDRVRRIVGLLSKRGRPPSVEAVAAHAELTRAGLDDLFRRWSGLTARDFISAATLAGARALLRDSAGVLEAETVIGAAAHARWPDLFVVEQAIDRRGAGHRGESLDLAYGFHPSPFGEAILVATDDGIAGLGFVDDGDRARALADMRRRWPRAGFSHREDATGPLALRSFDRARWRPDPMLPVVLIGTAFEAEVWRALIRVPPGCATTYSGLAARLGRPTAARAVGAAVGKNPISFVVPCHRVLGLSGGLTGYHWGLARKQAMLGWERGLVSGAPVSRRRACG